VVGQEEAGLWIRGIVEQQRQEFGIGQRAGTLLL
jgi:hypothetical protein